RTRAGNETLRQARDPVRRRCGSNRTRAARCRAGPACRVAAGRRCTGACAGRWGRTRIAVARVRKLRHVRQLRTSRPRVRRRGGGAALMALTMPYRNATRPYFGDTWLLVMAAMLLAFGLVMMTSASIEIAARTYNDALFHFKRQIAFMAMGLLCAYAVVQ